MSPQLQDGFNETIWNALEGAMQSIAESEEIYIVAWNGFLCKSTGGP
jgi:DNA/RNA endonuclease G (NUC1)